MTDDDPGALGGAPPRLTIAQRLLAALPNLQRQPARETPVQRSSKARTTRSERGADAGTDTDRDIGTEDAEADDTEAEAEAEAETDTDTAATSGDESVTGRRSTSGTRARPGDDFADMTNEEITHRIKRLDDRERFLALTSAPLGVLVGILLTVFAIHLNPPLRLHGKLNPKHVSESLIVLEGSARLVLSGIVVAAALTRRRSFVGFALLFLGTSMGSPLFALPFWVLGGYLIWRVFKYQRVLTARGGSTRGTRGARSTRASASAGTRGTSSDRRPTRGGKVPANPRAAGRAGAAAARQRAQAKRRGREPAPTGPTPSKRYTPPRPTRPRPPAPPS